MPPPRIRRYNYRRSNNWTCGCLGFLAGCLLVGIIAVIVLIPLMPSIAAQLMGFSPLGQTNDVFTSVSSVPPPQLENPMPVPQVSVNLGSYGVYTLDADTGALQVSVADNGQAATAHVTEAGIMDMCSQLSNVCQGGNPSYQNARIDLRPGGAIVYVDVNVAGLWQTTGIVLRVNGAQPRFDVAGVDIGGTLYSAPPDGLGATVSAVEHVGNDILGQLSVQAGGGSYAASEVYIDDTSLTLVLR